MDPNKADKVEPLPTVPKTTKPQLRNKARDVIPQSKAETVSDVEDIPLSERIALKRKACNEITSKRGRP